MSDEAAKVRPCQACGKDCTGQPRIKDKKGRYLHKACYEKAKAKAKAKKEAALAAAATESDDIYGLEDVEPALSDDMFGDVQAPQANAASCPDCGSMIQEGAVLCTVCGHNFQSNTSGGKIKVSKESGAKAMAASASVTSAAWLLALIGASIGGAIGAVGWAVVMVITGYEIGYIAVGVGFLCGLGAAIGAQSRAGLVSGLMAVGAAIVAIAVGKIVGVGVAISNDVGDLVAQAEAHMANPDMPWMSESDAILEMVNDESLRQERRGERLSWPIGQSWDTAYELQHFPSSIRVSVQMEWKKLTAEQRASKIDELMAEDMVASMADEVAWEKTEAGEQLSWPAGMSYDEAFMIEDYPSDIVADAQARWDGMTRAEQADYINQGVEYLQDLANNPEFAAELMSSSYTEKDLLFDVLWVILAAGAAFGTGANVARGDVA
ncbi:MAG: hypothetical protein Phyf2KO_18070 [Phycisphaerales bacterium]